MTRIRPILAFIAVVAALVLLTGDLSARPGGGGSFGSRGARTFSAPPATSTAPKAAAPIERTMTQPGTATAARAGAASPATGGFFNRPGLLGGLAAGFLGAGLFGMLFGNGFMGGLGGFASILGFVIQIALVVIVARLAWTWWQRRQGLATASGPALRGINEIPGARNFSGGGGAAVPSGSGTIETTPADFDAFERLLSDVSLAYGREDLAALRALATPEMLSYFSEDLAKNASRGVVNEVSGIKLLQGDLSEAWREGDAEYATVAMRYAITDVTIERAGGKVVDGSRSPTEVTELWTFRRARGGNWILSAIQQT